MSLWLDIGGAFEGEHCLTTKCESVVDSFWSTIGGDAVLSSEPMDYRDVVDAMRRPDLRQLWGYLSGMSRRKLWLELGVTRALDLEGLRMESGLDEHSVRVTSVNLRSSDVLSVLCGSVSWRVTLALELWLRRAIRQHYYDSHDRGAIFCFWACVVSCQTDPLFVGPAIAVFEWFERRRLSAERLTSSDVDASEFVAACDEPWTTVCAIVDSVSASVFEEFCYDVVDPYVHAGGLQSRFQGNAYGRLQMGSSLPLCLREVSEYAATLVGGLPTILDVEEDNDQRGW